MRKTAWPLRAVAALFIERQHLDRPRGQRLTARSLSRFAADTGGIQMDSINVVDRGHYLTAWSRFGPFDRAAFDRLAYRRRVLFEYFAHVACLVPIEHLPQWRCVMRHHQVARSLAFSGSRWAQWARKHGAQVRLVEGAIRERGPLGNSDFKQTRPEGESGWWNWKPATYAINYLWLAGRTAVHSRVHFQKRYDLIERVLPGAEGLVPPAPEDFNRWHVLQSLHAMGASTATDLRMYLTYPRIPAPARRRALDQLLRSGEVVKIEVERDRAPWLVRSADLPALEAAGRRREPARGSALLSPFDSFLWHRERTKKLFGYDYRIEVYTPGPKRVHGYYSLPIYQDGLLIGRLDAKNHRIDRRLELLHAHFEPWVAKGAPPPAASWGAIDPDRAMAGLADSVGSLATFLGAGRVTLGRVTPARLKPALARALRARPPAPVARAATAAEPPELEPDVPEPEAVS